MRSLALIFAASALLFSACDMAEEPPPPPPPPANTTPEILSVAPEDTTVLFRPQQPSPWRYLTVDAEASDADDDPLQYRWSASGGLFRVSGTNEVEGERVDWEVPLLAGDYTLALTVSDGEDTATASLLISVIPAVDLAWSGEIELSGDDETYDVAEFCLSGAPGVHSVLKYRQSGDNGGYSITYGGIGVDYVYPEVSWGPRAGDQDSQDEPLSFLGTISANGSTLSMTVPLESGRIRQFELSRERACSF